MELDREQQEVAQIAARLIVEDGLDYGSARRKAMQEHGDGGRRLRDGEAAGEGHRFRRRRPA